MYKAPIVSPLSGSLKIPKTKTQLLDSEMIKMGAHSPTKSSILPMSREKRELMKAIH